LRPMSERVDLRGTLSKCLGAGAWGGALWGKGKNAWRVPRKYERVGGARVISRWGNVLNERK